MISRRRQRHVLCVCVPVLLCFALLFAGFFLSTSHLKASDDPARTATLNAIDVAMTTIATASGTVPPPETSTPSPSPDAVSAAMATILAASQTASMTSTSATLSSQTGSYASLNTTPNVPCQNDNPLLADPCLAKPDTPELTEWRLKLGIVLAIQYVIGFVLARRLGNRTRRASYVWALIGVVLAFTKLGEGLYRLIVWVISWGVVGKILAVIVGFLSGIAGVGNLCTYVLSVHIFNDIEVMQLCVLPSIGFGFLMLFIYALMAFKPPKPPDWD